MGQIRQLKAGETAVRRHKAQVREQAGAGFVDVGGDHQAVIALRELVNGAEGDIRGGDQQARLRADDAVVGIVVILMAEQFLVVVDGQDVGVDVGVEIQRVLQAGEEAQHVDLLHGTQLHPRQGSQAVFRRGRQHGGAVAAGIVAGVLASLLSIFIMAKLFGLGHTEYVTLLPKSITTAIGMGVSEELGGYVTITVAVIVITGVLGNIFAELICKIFRINEPIAKGIAIGSASHAIGTAKAMEMGEIEGAMSSLSIAVAGILTVFGATLFSNFM